MAVMMLVEFAESGCPILRATSPFSRCRFKRKGHGKLSVHKCADLETIEFFSQDCFCKLAQSFQSNRGDIWRVWNFSWKNGETRCDGAIKFFTRVQCEKDKYYWIVMTRTTFSIVAIWRTNWKAVTTTNWANFSRMQDFWLLLILDSFLQYFMTKDTAQFSHFRVVARREYTLPSDEEASQPKG